MYAEAQKNSRKNNCMKLNQEDTNSIKIQRYLDGDMSGAERNDFEKDLAVDPVLKNLTDTYRNLAEGIRYHARQNAWNTIQQLEAGYAGEEIEMASSRKIWPAYAVAASVAIIAIAFAYNNNFIFNKSNRIFDEHFTPYQALVNGPTRSEAISKSLQTRAFSAYSNDNYQQAITLFEEIDALEDDPLIWFYLGNSYLAIDKPEDAINYFLEVLSQDTALTPQARWYLGLSYLANRDIGEAKKVFEALANDTTSYGERAKSILNQI